LHDQRIVRWNGEPATGHTKRQAGAATQDTQVWIGEWSLQREQSVYRCQVSAPTHSPAWSLELALRKLAKIT